MPADKRTLLCAAHLAWRYADRRIDPNFERKTRTLNVQHVYAEPDAPADAAPRSARRLNRWGISSGAKRIEYGEVAKVWRRKIK
ncbi:MAG: hypothetical protein U0521_10140 [Anaerolineae bacterium]